MIYQDYISIFSHFLTSLLAPSVKQTMFSSIWLPFMFVFQEKDGVVYVGSVQSCGRILMQCRPNTSLLSTKMSN